MLKQYKWKLLWSSVVILLPALVGLLLWNRLPERMPMHWNVHGEVDDYGSRGLVVIGIPLFLLALQGVCVAAWAFDRRNKDQNRKVMMLVLWIVPVLSVVVNGMVYCAALGYQPEVHRILCVVMGIFFALIGNYMPKCRQNRFIGIRVPWTLASEENWNATHRLAGRLWLVCGLLVAACSVLPGPAAFPVMMGLLFLMVVVPIVYSWRYEKKKG